MRSARHGAARRYLAMSRSAMTCRGLGGARWLLEAKSPRRFALCRPTMGSRRAGARPPGQPAPALQDGCIHVPSLHSHCPTGPRDPSRNGLVGTCSLRQAPALSERRRVTLETPPAPARPARPLSPSPRGMTDRFLGPPAASWFLSLASRQSAALHPIPQPGGVASPSFPGI